MIAPQADIVEVVRHHVPDLVERAPGDFWGCCPFHHEDTPSFHVRRDDGRFKCFGCGASGDAIDFVRRVQGIGYRQALDVLGQAPGVRPVTSPAKKPASAARLPYPSEVAEMIAATVEVTDDADVRAYLVSRGIDPDKVVSRISLGRALPRAAPCPEWARKSPAPGTRTRPWSHIGYRLIIPLFAAGTWGPVSFRARRIVPGEPKSISGLGLTTRGQVMADARGRHLLEHGRVADDWPARERLRVVIAEGEIDFITLATHWPDAHPAPVVIGITSGAWTADIAACIPSGAIVEIRTHDDGGGEAMAVDVIRTLKDRCSLERVLPAPVQP